MKKVIKYLIICICFFSLINVKNTKAETSSVVLLKEETNVEEKKSYSYNPNTLILVEIICGILGIIMLYIATKTTED